MNRSRNVLALQVAIAEALSTDDEYDEVLSILQKFETWKLVSLFRCLEYV